MIIYEGKPTEPTKKKKIQSQLMNSAMLVLCTLTVNNLKISLAKNSIGNNIKAQNRNSTLQSSTGNHHSVLARTKETERQAVSKSTSERRSNKRASPQKPKHTLQRSQCGDRTHRTTTDKWVSLAQPPRSQCRPRVMVNLDCQLD